MPNKRDTFRDTPGYVPTGYARDTLGIRMDTRGYADSNSVGIHHTPLKGVCVATPCTCDPDYANQHVIDYLIINAARRRNATV